MSEFYMGTHLITGAGCIEKNAGVFASYGRKCLIVTGRSGTVPGGPADAVMKVLAAEGIEYSVQVGSYQNPTVAQASETGIKAAGLNADYIIGIGGGSVLDLVKAASVFAANPELDEKGFYSVAWQNNPVPTILVGTTSGTGSEVTSVSVLIDSAGKKHSIHHKLLYGRYAFGDASYTMSLPESVTVSTGIDALSHCVESFFTKKASAVSKAFSVAGTKLFLQTVSGRESLSGDLPLPVRERLYDISILGGLAINITGTTFPHSMGYYFTETFSMPHGYASSLFMPELLRRAERFAPERFKEFFDSVGCSPGELESLLSGLMPDLDVRLTAEEIEKELLRWDNNSVKNCCYAVSLPDVREMLTDRFA